ncbi:MAG: helix-turn-helix domain-containing protein [Clostridia bacterium]
MVVKPVAQIYVYIHSNELKDAIFAYAEATNQNVYDVIADVWRKMLDSKDYSIKSTIGSSQGENPRISLTMDIHIANEAQKIFDHLAAEGVKGVSWTSWTQEGIWRYLEPVLLKEGYLKDKVFRDKAQAARNIKYLRSAKGLSQNEFIDIYLTVEDEKLISLPQYSLIERSGKGNVERLVSQLAEVLKIDEEILYSPSTEFLNALNFGKI